MTKRVAIYIRVSTLDQAREGYSLSAQRKALTRWAKEHSYEIIGYYADEGISGKDIKHRPDMQRLLEDVAASKVDVIIVWALSRFTRSVADLYNMWNILNKHNCGIISYTEAFDTTTIMGRAMMGMLAIFAQMEKDGTEFVLEDMRPLGEKTIREHFPNIYQHCLDEGYDPCKEPIPVVPAQHYFMGGIKVDLGSRTSMKGLYACGETSCNGVHGKNRLASNSLLESLVFARRAADDIMFGEEPEFDASGRLDCSRYEDRDAILGEYHKAVRSEIERMKKSHE